MSVDDRRARTMREALFAMATEAAKSDEREAEALLHLASRSSSATLSRLARMVTE